MANASICPSSYSLIVSNDRGPCILYICIPTGCRTMVRFMIYRQWQCCPVCFTRTTNILPPS